MEYDPFKRPSAQQVLNHPYFTKSIINKDATIWGAKSLREKDLGNLGANSNLYKPAKSNVFNIQNKAKMDPYKNDIDLDFDNDLNEIMNKDFNKSLKPGNVTGMNSNKNPSNNLGKAGENSNSKIGGGGDFNNDFQKNNMSKLNKDIDEFDVFGITPSPNDKKGTPKVDPQGKGDDFGSIFSNQAIRNQNHYNSHSSGVLGKEVGMGKFTGDSGYGGTGQFGSNNTGPGSNK